MSEEFNIETIAGKIRGSLVNVGHDEAKVENMDIVSLVKRGAVIALQNDDITMEEYSFFVSPQKVVSTPGQPNPNAAVRPAAHIPTEIQSLAGAAKALADVVKPGYISAGIGAQDQVTIANSASNLMTLTAQEFGLLQKRLKNAYEFPALDVKPGDRVRMLGVDFEGEKHYGGAIVEMVSVLAVRRVTQAGSSTEKPKITLTLATDDGKIIPGVDFWSIEY